MADPDGVAAALRSHFDTELAAVEPDVQVLHDNDPPLGEKPGTHAPNPSTEQWVRVAVAQGAGGLPEIDSRLAEIGGRLVVSVFTGLGQGAARAEEIARKVRDIFQAQKVGGARLAQTEFAVLGASLDNTWFQVNASTPFRYESTP